MARQVPVYKLKDDAGEILDGTFYEPELQKIIKNDDVYRVEKILRKRKRKGVVEYLVRWKGYKDPKFDSWTVSLTGDWEVALTEIHYPHSWNNVQENFGNRFYLRNQELSGVWEALIVLPGHYSSIGDILSKMKELIENVKRFNDDVTFSYDAFTRKVTVHLQNNVELFFGNIGYLPGFSPEEIISNTSTAERQVDLEYGFHDLFIYCDLIQSQYVGDALVPLLRIVPVEGKVGERVSKSFLRPQYLPVSRKQFETVEVNIKTDTRGVLLLKMKKFHTPNHKLYEQYYVNQAKQKGGNLPAFHGARFQNGYGLGSIFRGLFRWAMPHLQQGAKVIGKKAL
ncbi:unnamed protein product [Porites lobata]|uniref:Chromo domain-containing protein n=1 Tax=Porites lobata TaxID=104759 RepID=A0ABN8RSR4_9CNID|nr:unnamed protein product [Porites lobata]